MSIADDILLFGDEYQDIKKLDWDELDTRELPKSFRLTKTFQEIQERIRYAATIQAPLMTVTGTHGAGKSMGTRYYAQKHAATAWECRPGYSAKVVLRDLCRELGINAGSGWDMQTSVVAQQLEGHPRVFVLDEAQRLDYNGLDLLKWVADRSGSTFVLVASPSLEKRIERWPDIDSRCPVKLRVAAMTAAELTSIYKSDGYSAEALAEIHVQTRGVMRNVQYLFRHIEEAMKASAMVSKPEHLSADHVKSLSRKIFG